MSPLPSVSVIIVNYNGERIIQHCLASVLQSDYPHFEVLVIDNCSSDNSLRQIEPYRTDLRVKLIVNERNLGFAEGCNQGARNASGRYLFFLNNDTEVTKDAISRLVSLLALNPLAGAAQSKLLLLNDRSRLDSAGDTVSTIGWPTPLGKYEIDLGQFDSGREVFSGRGAALMVPKAVFEEVGGFDSDYFMYYEDVDLSWRIRLRGYLIAFAPQSIVYHLAGSGRSGKFSESLYSGRNYIATLVKNLELRNLLVYGSAHIVVHLATVLFYLSKRRTHEALGMILALFEVVEHFPSIWRKRVAVQRMRLVSDERILAYAQRPSLSEYLMRHVK